MAEAIVAVGAIGCVHPAAQEIYSVPRVACPKQDFVLKWKARGEGSISANPAPAGWTDLPVKDSGEKGSLSIEAKTTFTLTVPAADERNRSQAAEVLLLTAAPDRSVQVQCDVPGKLYGTFSLADVPEGVRVRRLHDAYATTDGTQEFREVCVTHLFHTHCVAASQSIELDEAAQGTWQLSLPPTLAVDCENGPGKLGIQLDFECH